MALHARGMSVAPQECSCEAFLWHPLCIPYEHVSQTMVLNDDYLRKGGRGGVQAPGGTSLEDEGSLGIDWPGLAPDARTGGHALRGTHEGVQVAIERWVRHRGWATLRIHHAIIDPERMRIKIVDYIFKDKRSQRVWLAVVYRAERRGGAQQKAMSDYVAAVASTCRRHMNFFAECVVICVHGAEGDRVYSKRVDWRLRCPGPLQDAAPAVDVASDDLGGVLHGRA